MNSPNLITRWLIRAVIWGVGLFSPTGADNARRILFLSSFNAALVAERFMDEETLSTLNHTLSVANSQHSLEIGFDLSSYLWSEHEITTLFGNNNSVPKRYLGITEIEQLYRSIKSHTPSWLLYDDAEMRYDMIDLLSRNKVAML